MKTKEVPAYLPDGAHVSSSRGAWINYFGRAPDPYTVLVECSARVGEPCILINGSDDWTRPHKERPQAWVGPVIEPDQVVAWYHSGVSGITRSGLVVRQSDAAQIGRRYADLFGVTFHSTPSVKCMQLGAGCLIEAVLA